MLLSRIVIAGSLLTTPAVLVAQSVPVPPMHTPPIQTAEVVNGATLPSDTDVWMRFDQAVDSRTVRQGDKLAMRVSRDVMLGNRIVIPHGASGHGMVSRRTGKGAFGKSGKLDFEMTDVMVDGRSVPLSGQYHIAGNGNTGATVGAVLAVGVFSAFVKGHSAIVPEGSEWRGTTKEAVAIASVPIAAPGGVTVTRTN